MFFTQYSLCPLIIGVVKYVFQQRQGHLLAVGPEAKAANGGHQESSPSPFFRKSGSCFCYRPEKQLAFMAHEGLFFFTSK